MKNKELIEFLKKQPEDLDVCIFDSNNTLYGSSYGSYSDFDVEYMSDDDGSDDFIALSFKNKINKLKPHSEYEFYDGDKVFVENGDESFSFFILSYQEAIAAWVLIPYKDEKFEKPLSDDNKHVNCELLYEFGIDVIESMDEFVFED